MSRDAYLLTKDKTSQRALFCNDILRNVGFNVIFVECIPHKNSVISNKISMQHIYELIAKKETTREHSYVFEDDINVHSHIALDEIIKYEILSPTFFYLGICEDRGKTTIKNTHYSVYGRPVISISGNVRGLHAIGISVEGAKELLDFMNRSPHDYMDMILEDFSRQHPANVLRYDLQSNIHGHRGMFYQDRNRFPSTISTHQRMQRPKNA